MFTRFTTIRPPMNISRAMQNQLEELVADLGRNYSQTVRRDGIDFYENDDHYLVQADLPGFDSSLVDITLEGQSLKISADESTQPETGQNPKVIGRRKTSFTRVLRVPETVELDNIKASLEHGLLTVTLPKRAEDKMRKIQIN